MTRQTAKLKPLPNIAHMVAYTIKYSTQLCMYISYSNSTIAGVAPGLSEKTSK